MEKIYKVMYYHLFNCITDALTELQKENAEKAKEMLIAAQQKTEEMYIQAETTFDE